MEQPNNTTDPSMPSNRWLQRSLLFLIGYFGLGCVTMPFVGKAWLGELPVFALLQLPQLYVATWLRKNAVMPALNVIGLSKGSFSPDYVTARPYGLLLAYLIFSLFVLGIVWWRTRLAPPYRKLTIFVLIAAAADLLAIFIFGAPHGGYTIY